MKKFINIILSDRVLLWGFGISIAFILLSASIVLAFYKSLPPFIPLYNAMSWGYARIGQKYEFFIPLGIAGFLFLVNCILSIILYGKTALLSRSLCAVTGILSLLTLIFTIQTLVLIH